VSATVPQALKAFAAHGIETRPDERGALAWDAECGVCGHLSDATWPVRITEAWPGGPARVRCISGCDERAILAAVGLGDALAGSPVLPAPVELGDSRRRALRFYDVDGMLGTVPPPIPWLLPRVLARGTLTLLAGQPKTGKSMLGLRIAAAIGQGAMVLGRQCEQGRVLIIDGENGKEIAHRRVRAFGVKPGTVSYAGTEGFSLRESLWEIEEYIAAFRPALVVLDAFRSLTPGEEENDSGAVEAALAPLRTLARRYKCAVLLLHHFAKAGGPRGSSAFGAAVDNTFHLLRDERDPTRQRRTLTNPECRFAPEAAPISFAISEGDDGSVTLEAVEPPPTTSIARSGPPALEARFVRLLTEHGELSRAELCERAGVSADDGYVSRILTDAVRSGRLLRPGRGRYGLPAPDRSSLPPSAIGGEEGGMNLAEDREAAA
jgi:hypothetical protein